MPFHLRRIYTVAIVQRCVCEKKIPSNLVPDDTFRAFVCNNLNNNGGIIEIIMVGPVNNFVCGSLL